MKIDISVFDKVLGEGEHLEWVGRTEPFRLVSGENKSGLIKRWLICFAVCAVLTAAYLIFAMSSIAGVQAAVPVIIIGACLYAAVRPFFDARSLIKRNILALTNNRVIVYKSELDVQFMDLSQLREVKIITKPNGLGDAAFGAAAVEAPHSKWFSIAVTPKSVPEGTDKKVTGIVFYNVGDLEKIKELLDRRVNVSELAAG